MDAKRAELKNPPLAVMLRQRILIPAIIILALLLVIQAGRVVAAALRVRSDLEALQGMAAGGSLALLAPESIESIDGLLARSESDVHDLRANAGPLVYVGPLLGWVPRYGGDLANAPALLEFADELLSGARVTFGIGMKLNAALSGAQTGQASMGRPLAAALSTQAGAIQEARRSLLESQRLRNRINPAALSPSLRSAMQRFDRLLGEWQSALDGLALGPLLLGGDRPRVYLLLLQNSDELRATGGFISSVALLRVDHGDIQITDFQDSFAVDDMTQPHPEPPQALLRYMQAEQLLLRDANWSPDFPTAAKTIASLYTQDRGVELDGVIAVSLKALPRLLEGLGPITLGAYNETVDRSNVVAKLQEYWGSPNGQGKTADWWEHRKDFIGNLLGAIAARVQTGNLNMVPLARALLDSIAAKDLLVYVEDAGETGAGKLGGAVTQTYEDALMIVDSNVGFNKVDVNVERRADYNIYLASAGDAAVRLGLTYTNRSPGVAEFCVHTPRYAESYGDLQRGCYWDYLRIVAAPEARFITSTVGIDAGVLDRVRNRAVFEGYVVVGGGQTRRVEYRYQIPNVIRNGDTYRLHIEKQPGAPTWNLHVRISLPGDWIAFTTDPMPNQIEGQILEYDLVVDRDQHLTVVRQSTFAGDLALGVVLGSLALLGGTGWWFVRNRQAEAPDQSFID